MGPRLADNSSEDSFEAAAARLDRALGRLDVSVRSLNSRMRSLNRIEADAHRLVNERARLAQDFDKASAKAKRLDDTAQDVSRRLVDAMETVRQVLSK